MNKKASFFPGLGIFGFDAVEKIILAALVSGDPILLIGRSGTGKTFLLNSISEAMSLNHRHYNASMISFDDLIGFPYPAEDGNSIRYLQTEASIWDAESVLVDELSRCKPETQNKFFSIIHERKIQGITLSKLQFRWAAMNPFAFDGSDLDDQYEGSEALDQALADRFAFIVNVPDWEELSVDDQDLVIHPAGVGALSDDNGQLKAFVEKVRPKFLEKIKKPQAVILSYARYATSLMNKAGYRISPRRARMFARNITALECVEKELGRKLDKDAIKLALTWSLPQRAWKGPVPQHIIDSVHANVVNLVFSSNVQDRWLAEFTQRSSIPRKVSMLLDDLDQKDIKSIAVIRFMQEAPKWQSTVFAFCIFPLLNKKPILSDEANNEVAKCANPIYNVKGKFEWQERLDKTGTSYPRWSECQKVLNRMSPKTERMRIIRAKQLFLNLLSQNVDIPDPSLLENELQATYACCAKKMLELS